MHTVNSLHMINNLFCNKGRRSIAQVLNQNFSKKKIEVSLTNDLTD